MAKRTKPVARNTLMDCPFWLSSWMFMPNVEVAREKGTKMNARNVTTMGSQLVHAWCWYVVVLTQAVLLCVLHGLLCNLKVSP